MGDYKYYQLDSDENIVVEFDSIKQILDIINATHNTILDPTRNEYKKVGRYYWRREKIDHYNKYKDEIWKPTNTKTGDR